MFLKFHAQFITLTEIGLSATNQGKDTTPPATQTKPGLFSCQSFNHKNHSADNTPTTNHRPKKIRFQGWKRNFCFN
jgi:hypothetical protein